MATIGSSQRMRMVGPEPPGTPDNFSATASTTAPKAINLSWSAPSGPAAVTGYKLSRGGSLIATQAGTTYSDTGLAAYNTQYSYSVVAYNADGDSITPATANGTTAVQCNNASGSLTPTNGTYGTSSTSSQTAPAGCFKIRIRALGGGAGGRRSSTYTHEGQCRDSWGGYFGAGGGGGYVDGYAPVTPGTSYTLTAGHAGNRGGSGGYSGIDGLLAVNGGYAGTNINPGNPGGDMRDSQPGQSFTAGDASLQKTGGAAALDGTNPTGSFSHGGERTQPCGNSSCSGCTGPAGYDYGGGGAAGTSSGALYGETSYHGGYGGRGYVVWNFAESS